MSTSWHTVWQGADIVVYRNAAEVDRIAAGQIARVIFVHRGAGDKAGDLLYSLVELPDEYVLLPADTGFAGRVNFERLSFWSERQCVYWLPHQQAALPGRLKRGLWLLRPALPVYARVPRSELASCVEVWPLAGPQTWEQRKWKRIALGQPFANTTMPGELETPAPRRRA